MKNSLQIKKYKLTISDLAVHAFDVTSISTKLQDGGRSPIYIYLRENSIITKQHYTYLLLYFNTYRINILIYLQS